MDNQMAKTYPKKKKETVKTEIKKIKFHKAWIFGGFGKRGQTHIRTRFMFYKYR